VEGDGRRLSFDVRSAVLTRELVEAARDLREDVPPGRVGGGGLSLRLREELGFRAGR
jgi:hypothetical protein